jgi:Adenylate and Guanylate cyclase catalytic domain
MACARTIVSQARELDLDVRAGIHTGECEVVGEKLAGIAVVTGARVAALANPGEVLVSQTVKDLVAGSGFDFVDRGAHELKGVPGHWGLYSGDDEHITAPRTLACANSLTLEFESGPGRSRTKVAPTCKARRSAATNDPRKAVPIRASGMNRPPPHVHGKEAVPGSSPGEGLNTCKTALFLLPSAS